MISDISPGAKVRFSNGNVRFENFMHAEWSEEKFLKGIVGDKRRLRPLPFNNSWKSENRVSKSKIEFPALASI